jgi:hypothetical protein
MTALAPNIVRLIGSVRNATVHFGISTRLSTCIETPQRLRYCHGITEDI